MECDAQRFTAWKEESISTHALTWSATTCLKCSFNQKKISTHALTWSATEHCRTRRHATGFQLTHSRGVRHHSIEQTLQGEYFNSRTHVECDATETRDMMIAIDFNSRTHVECDLLLTPANRLVVISTHALTWSATIKIREPGGRPTISTHALTWSATTKRPGRRGANDISTHALTWSATLNIVLKKDSPHSIWEVIAFYHQLS